MFGWVIYVQVNIIDGVKQRLGLGKKYSSWGVNKLEAWVWVTPSKRFGMDGVFFRLAGLLRGISRGRSPREIRRSSPASPRKTPSIPIFLIGFTFYSKYDILVIFLNLSNTDVWRSMMVAKLVEYVYWFIRVLLVLLGCWYVP